jgi:hypothetical protein
MGSFTTVAWIAAVIVVAAVIIYGLSRRRPPPPRELPRSGERPADPAAGAFAAAGAEPPTEDEIARARLGGPRGAPQLGEAPLPRQARKQTPRDIDDGHTA